MSSILRTNARRRGEWKRRKVECTDGKLRFAFEVQHSTKPGTQGPAQTLSVVEERRRFRRSGSTLPNEGGPIQRARAAVRSIFRGDWLRAIVRGRSRRDAA